MDERVLLSLLVIVPAVLIIAFIGLIPGMIAKKRNHPNVDAVRICGFIGIFTFGILWLIALIWAYASPGQKSTKGVTTAAPSVGKYQVIGTDRRSGQQRTFETWARDVEEAKFKAFEDGLDVAGVRQTASV